MKKSVNIEFKNAEIYKENDVWMICETTIKDDTVTYDLDKILTSLADKNLSISIKEDKNVESNVD